MKNEYGGDYQWLVHVTDTDYGWASQRSSAKSIVFANRCGRDAIVIWEEAHTCTATQKLLALFDIYTEANKVIGWDYVGLRDRLSRLSLKNAYFVVYADGFGANAARITKSCTIDVLANGFRVVGML